MIGKLDPNYRKVTVVGGGVSGLIAAYQCSIKGYEVDIIEKSNHFGGLIQTHQITHNGSMIGIAESAAHSFLLTKKVEQFLKDLDIDIVEINQNSKARYINRNNKLMTFPLNIFETIGMFLRMIFKIRLYEPLKESLEEFCIKFLGKPALKYLLTPFVTGVYASKPSELQVKAAFPFLNIPVGHTFLSHFLVNRFFKKKSKTKMVSLKNGMNDLANCLLNHLQKNPKVRFIMNQEVQNVLDSKNIIYTVPAYVLSKIFIKEDKVLSDALLKIEYAKLISVTVFCPKNLLRKNIKGVGVLSADPIKDKENQPTGCLGVLFNSSSFKGRVFSAEYESFTMMFDYQYVSEISKQVVNVMSFLFAFKGSFENLIIKEFKYDRAIPKYGENILTAWEDCARYVKNNPGVVFYGNWSGQVSLRGMIESALENLA